MKLGMTLLVSDGDYNLVLPSVLYHQNMADLIVCVAHKPSKMLEFLLKSLDKNIKNFIYLGNVAEKYSPEAQATWVNSMVHCLIKKGIDWVVNLDGDEFYYGNLKSTIEWSENNNLNCFHTDGFCFYQTVIDSKNPNPVRSMLWRDNDEVDYNYRKVIHRTKNFYSISPGNHWVIYENITPSNIIFKNIQIFHYSFRSKSMWSYKTLTKEDIKNKSLKKDERLVFLFDNLGLPV